MLSIVGYNARTKSINEALPIRRGFCFSKVRTRLNDSKKFFVKTANAAP
ncbi:Uncharacterised protein [Klebsiella pneumoniae]|nr:Uncharacterised protein [Klebsiella pneumoniae]